MAIPSLDKAELARKEAEAEEAFWREHYNEYLEKYPDKFVAVYQGAIVATDPDLGTLVRIVEGKGLDRRQVSVRYITADPRRVIL